MVVTVIVPLCQLERIFLNEELKMELVDAINYNAVFVLY